VPKHCLDARLLLYAKVAGLGAQVERLFAVAGRERSHVIVFDDLVADPLGVYQRALEFLGVDYDGQAGSRPGTKAGCIGIAGCSACCSCPPPAVAR
jgi:hypothetical protein